MIKKIKSVWKIIKLYKNWPIFFLAYSKLLKKQDVILKFRNGLKWHVNTTKGGFGVLNDVYIYGIYDEIKKIKNPKIIVDAGAQIGSFSILSSVLYPQSKIFSIEANSENIDKLMLNIKDNKIKNIKVLDFAVSVHDGVTQFYVSQKNTGYSSIIPTNNSRKTEVKCYRLSSIFKMNKIKECDVLKLDIEDMELQVLKNAQKEGILKNIKNIFIEFYRTSDKKEGEKFLENNGFTIRKEKGIFIASRAS